MTPHLLAQVPPIYNPAINSQVGDVLTHGGNSIPIVQLFLQNLLTLALSVAGLYFFFNLIRGGYEWITAGGDKEAVQKARSRIQNALVGVIIVFSVYAITFVVEYVLGISLLTFNIPRP